MTSQQRIRWIARAVLLTVLFFNMTCAIEFIVRPSAYTASFEVDGVAGATLVRGMGILFLMWNATYPIAIWDPWRHRSIFAVIIAQQAIGLLGEAWMLLALPVGHAALVQTGLRFVVFDSGGLVAFLMVWAMMLRAAHHTPVRHYDPNDTTCGPHY